MKIIVFLLLFLPLGIYGQQDSTANLTGENNNIARLHFLATISAKLIETDVIKATACSLEGLALAKKLNDPVGTEQFEGRLGHIMRLRAEQGSAREFYLKALALAKLNKAPEREAEYFNGMSVLYRQQGELQQATAFALQALKAATIAKSPKQTGDAYHNIGYVFNILNNYDSALLYFKRGLVIRKTTGDSASISASYNGVGLVFMKMENYDTARSLYLKAASLVSEESNPRLLAMVYNNIGITYENQGHYDKSRAYYLRSLAMKEKIHDRRGMAATNNNLGDSYRESGDPDRAIYHALLGEQLSIETRSLEYLITSHKILSFAYQQKKDFRRALTEHQTFMKLQDSLYNENKTKQINELMSKSAMERKEAENTALKTTAIINQFSIARQKTVIIAVVLTLLITSSLLIFVYRIYRTSKKIGAELAVQKAEAESANIMLKSVLEENNHMMSIMVHDLRSPMNRVLGLADLIEKDGTLNDYQATYLKMISQAVGQGRRVVDDLLTISRKEAFNMETFPAEPFLRDFLIQYKSAAAEKNIELRFRSDSAGIHLHADKEACRRIFDNLVSNAIKFSPTGKTVTLELATENNAVVIYVSDEGPGFSEEDRSQLYQKFTRLSARPTGGEGSTGLGLAIVKQLVDQLQGSISLVSAPGEGSVFKVVFQPAAK